MGILYFSASSLRQKGPGYGWATTSGENESNKEESISFVELESPLVVSYSSGGMSGILDVFSVQAIWQ